MKKFIQLLVLLLPVFAGTVLQAQTKSITITGKVISFEESLGLEGVSIVVKGTSYNSGTHADGTFSLSVDSPDKILVFSLEGYQTTELKLNENSRDYEVVLKRGTGDKAAVKAINKNWYASAARYSKKKNRYRIAA